MTSLFSQGDGNDKSLQKVVTRLENKIIRYDKMKRKLIKRINYSPPTSKYSVKNDSFPKLVNTFQKAYTIKEKEKHLIYTFSSSFHKHFYFRAQQL